MHGKKWINLTFGPPKDFGPIQSLALDPPVCSVIFDMDCFISAHRRPAEVSPTPPRYLVVVVVGGHSGPLLSWEGMVVWATWEAAIERSQRDASGPSLFFVKKVRSGENRVKVKSKVKIIGWGLERWPRAPPTKQVRYYTPDPCAHLLNETDYWRESSKQPNIFCWNIRSMFLTETLTSSGVIREQWNLTCTYRVPRGTCWSSMICLTPSCQKIQSN